MTKKYVRGLCIAALLCLLAGGCGKSDSAESAAETIGAEADNAAADVSEAEEAEDGADTEENGAEAFLPDGEYLADFDTDSSMFRVNEACEGKGTLTVKDGEMVLHVSLTSKKIVNLFPGLAADAEKEGAALLEPTVDTVTYSDGTSEEVNGFDIPVPALDTEFDLALLGTKGTWYDHKVSVSNPEETEAKETDVSALPDGEYSVGVTLQGGSGKAGIASPASLRVKDGAATARIEWSSSHYDYMKIDGETYYPVNQDGNSVFEIPVAALDEAIFVTADTTAMSTPHEISYTLYFYLDFPEESATISDSRAPDESAIAVDRDISPQLAYERRMKLSYATQFAADYYDGGYVLITISDGSRFLVVPNGAALPEDLEEDITVLKQPIQNIYLAASAVMDMIRSLDALEAVSLSGIQEESWYIEEAREAMAAGEISYAGKYNAPDYEKILNTRCSLAVESTMILHSPQVREQLIRFGVPVLVDRSSYEKHPVGRMEWVKLYGILLNREDAAARAFEEQKAAYDQAVSKESTGKSVAFFYITENETVSVRKSADYVTQMIEAAGGVYVFSDLGGESDSSATVNMQMEEFYAQAKDADFLIYNGTIDESVDSLKDLLAKSPLLSDFKAVKEGRVFCTTRNLYQDSMKLGTVTSDFHAMLTQGDTSDETFHYLFRLT